MGQRKKQIGLLLVLFGLFVLFVNSTTVPSEVQLAADKAAVEYVEYMASKPDSHNAAAGNISTAAYLAAKSTPGPAIVEVLPTQAPVQHARAVMAISATDVPAPYYGTATLVKKPGDSSNSIYILTAAHVVVGPSLVKMSNSHGQILEIDGRRGTEFGNTIAAAQNGQFGDQLLLRVPPSVVGSNPLIQSLIRENAIPSLATKDEVLGAIRGEAKALTMGFPLPFQQSGGSPKLLSTQFPLIGMSSERLVYSRSEFGEGVTVPEGQIALGASQCGGAMACGQQGFSGSGVFVKKNDGSYVIVGNIFGGNTVFAGATSSVSGSAVSLDVSVVRTVVDIDADYSPIPEVIRKDTIREHNLALTRNTKPEQYSKAMAVSSGWACQDYGDCGQNKDLYAKSLEKANGALGGTLGVFDLGASANARLAVSSVFYKSSLARDANLVPLGGSVSSSLNLFEDISSLTKLILSDHPLVPTWMSIFPSSSSPPNVTLNFVKTGSASQGPYTGVTEVPSKNSLVFNINANNPLLGPPEQFVKSLGGVHHPDVANTQLGIASLVGKRDLLNPNQPIVNISSNLDFAQRTSGVWAVSHSAFYNLYYGVSVMSYFPRMQYAGTGGIGGYEYSADPSQPAKTLDSGNLNTLVETAYRAGATPGLFYNPANGKYHAVVKLPAELGGFKVRIPYKKGP